MGDGYNQIDPKRYEAAMLAKTQERVNSSDDQRYHAIADFILSTSATAHSLNSILRLTTQCDKAQHDTAMECAAYHVKLIEERYRELFGTELGR